MSSCDDMRHDTDTDTKTDTDLIRDWQVKMLPPISAPTASFIHISLLISTPLLVKLEIARPIILDRLKKYFQKNMKIIL